MLQFFREAVGVSSAAFSAYTSQAMDKLGGQRMQAQSFGLQQREQSDIGARL